MPDSDALPQFDSSAPPPRKRKPKGLILLAWLVLLGGLFGWITTYNPGDKVPKETGGPDLPQGPDPAKLAAAWPQIQAHAAAPPLGPANAPYTIIEFGDFQCPPCGKTRPKIEAMLAKYPTQANLLFVDRPLPAIHHWAVPAAQAAQFASSQGKFWQMYDQLYQNQDNLEPGYYGDYAAKIGLNKQQMQDAISSKQYEKMILDDINFTDSLQIVSTPTVLCRDNRTGKIQIIPYGQRGAVVYKFLANPPWASQSKTASGPASPTAAKS